jgi:hypothetical protein
MEIKGKVLVVGNTVAVSEKFKKRDLIVEYVENPQYPEQIKFEAVQDKTSLLDSVKVGDEINVHFNLRGRGWTDKTGKTQYSNTLSVWRLTPATATEGVDVAQVSLAGGDDLPF